MPPIKAQAEARKAPSIPFTRAQIARAVMLQIAIRLIAGFIYPLLYNGIVPVAHVADRLICRADTDSIHSPRHRVIIVDFANDPRTAKKVLSENNGGGCPLFI